MKALILAAGFGTRLKPFTLHKPKALVPVNDTPLILYTLAFLKKYGIREVVINLHHLGHHIPKLLKNGQHLGLKIRYSHESKILGTGGGIKKALPYLSDDFLILNGDIITDFNLKDMIATHKKSKPLATLGLYAHKNAAQYGQLYHHKGSITSILNHPKAQKPYQIAMFSGIHIISKTRIKAWLKTFKAQQKFCIVRDVYIPALLQSHKLSAHKIKGFWSVCDHLTDVENTAKKLTEKGFELSYKKGLKQLSNKI